MGYKIKGGRKRSSVLKARQADYDANAATYERAMGYPGGYHRPGSQQKDRRR